MKRQKIMSIALTALMTTGLMGVQATFAGEGEPKLKGNHLQNRVEYKDMKATMSRIDQDQARIEKYKAELKANREADDRIAIHMSKKNLKKAKADLKGDKKHLRIDRRDLKKDQQVAIISAHIQAYETWQELKEAKRKLRKDLRQDNASELAADIQRIETLTKQLEKEDQKTIALEQDVEEFFAYLDEEIDETLA